MSEPNTGRRTIAEIAFGGTDISSSIRPYLLSMSYTDNEEDQTDSLTIQLQDRAGIWLNQWLADMVDTASNLVDDPEAASSKTDGGTKTYTVSAQSGLNIRTGPGVNCSRIDGFPNGASVSVKSIENGWAKIDYNGQEAYVSANYLVAADGTANKAAAPAMQTVTGGRVVPAEFTAYYPHNDPMEGGLYAANGEELDPSKRTCAIPKSLPFGTSVLVQGTGTACDGRIYRGNDHGGAIVVKKDGTYCFDLLMSSYSECMNFGRRRGTAIIGGKITTTVTKTTTQTTNTTAQNGTADYLVAVARKEIGYHEKGDNDNKYGEWAGRNGVAWCVQFVCWCSYHAKAPIPTGYAAVSEMSSYFKSKGLYRSASSGYIPKPGDLMIQTTQHIAIVEKADSSGVWTIDGNYSNSVQRVYRRYSEISGFCTPQFADLTPQTTTKTTTSTTTSGSEEKPKDNTLPAGKLSALQIQAAFLQQNWNADGKDTLLNCGEFELDSITESFPPMTVTIKATSLPYRSTVRQTQKSRAWEAMSLSAIANQIAQENGMLCLFESENDPVFPRVEQFKTSDIAFLSQLCKDAGISLKATNHMLVLFHQATYEAKEPAFAFFYGDGSYLTFKGNIGKSDTSYTMCRVYSFDPKTKKTVEGFAYVTDYKKDDKNNHLLELQAKVSSIADAQKLAQIQLRLHNKYAQTCTLTLPGNPQIVSGMVVELKKWGLWTGKYMVKQAVHTVNSSGYVTKITLRHVLEGY